MKYPIGCVTKNNPFCDEVAPDWFQDSGDIRGVKDITKMFDTLGLKNFTATAKLDSSTAIPGMISNFTNDFDDERIELSGGYQSDLAETSIRNIVYQLEENISNGKLLNPINDERNIPIFKKGTALKTIIQDALLRCKALSKERSYIYNEPLKEISDSLYLSKNKTSHKIVFSTHPWDILTMSMRGIESCMEWSSSHCTRLIGSVICPYVGIIYATNGAKTPFGKYMTHRSVVRLVKSTKNKSSYHLYVEGAYPKVDDRYDDEVADAAATEMFRNVLAKKIKGNKKIVNVLPFEATYGYYVPLSNQVRALLPGVRTYFDSNLTYR